MGGLDGNSASMVQSAATGYGLSRGTRFALTKFRPPALPSTLITRSVLHDRLTAGAGQRLTIVVGSAGAGKSVLLSDWAAARSPGVTSWLSCDKADADRAGSGPASSRRHGSSSRGSAPMPPNCSRWTG